MDWDKLAEESDIEKTTKALIENGIETTVVADKEEARKRILELLPKGAEVLEVTSTTLDQIGVSADIENGDYKSVKKIIRSESDEKKRNELRKKSVVSEYVIGSVHAVTEKGEVVIASASGSQLAPYSYSAMNVIWVVGTQKIVKDLDTAFKRIYEYDLKLESERVQKVYNMPRSSVNKILIFEKERPGRIKLIFVKEKLGF